MIDRRGSSGRSQTDRKACLEIAMRIDRSWHESLDASEQNAFGAECLEGRDRAIDRFRWHYRVNRDVNSTVENVHDSGAVETGEYLFHFRERRARNVCHEVSLATRADNRVECADQLFM